MVARNLESSIPRTAELPITCTEYFTGGKSRQYFSGFAVNLGVFSIGTAWSWTATAVPDLKRSQDLGIISASSEAWITSIVFLSAILGCGFSGYSMQKVGLRMSMLLLTVPLVAGWGLIAGAQNVLMVLGGRIVTGFCAGGITLAVPVFVAETVEASIRGKIGFGYDLMGSVGVLYIFIVGSYVSWRWQAVACGIIPIIFHILVLMLPDSPRSLMERGHHLKAAEALVWFRCAKSTDQVQQELAHISQSVSLDRARKASNSWKEYFTAETLKPTWIGICLMFFLQMCGAIPVLAYTADIFAAAGSNDIYFATVLVGAAQVIVTILTAFFVDRVGRRILLILSEIFMAIPLVALGSFFYLKNSDGVPETLSWLPLASLVLFISAFSIGFGPIPWVLLGELTPPTVKGFSSAIVTITNRGVGFLVVYFFNYIIEWLGQHGCYWLFAGICGVGAIYVYFCVPETKGRTLQEIRDGFGRIKKNESANKSHNDNNAELHI